MATIYVSSYGNNLQAAIAAAQAGDTVVIDVAGSYTGDITISKAITLQGANAGVAGTDGTRNPESNIVGAISRKRPRPARSSSTACASRIRRTTRRNSTGSISSGAADVRLENSIIHSDGPNGGNAGSWGDVAVYMGTGATGHVHHPEQPDRRRRPPTISAMPPGTRGIFAPVVGHDRDHPRQHHLRRAHRHRAAGRQCP